MGEFTFTRVWRSKFLRRSSTSSVTSDRSLSTAPPSPALPTTAAASTDLPSSDSVPTFSSAPTTPDFRGRRASSTRSSVLERSSSPRSKRQPRSTRSQPSDQYPIDAPKSAVEGPKHRLLNNVRDQGCPELTVQEPTPDQPVLTPFNQKREVNVIEEEFEDAVEDINNEPEAETRPTTVESQIEAILQRPDLGERGQSLVPAGQQKLIQSLLQSGARPQSRSAPADFLQGTLPPINAGMVHRKIWVKRPGASATLVTVTEEDVVDDVREAILKKYGNSLGRSLDAPDITLKIVSREQSGRAAPNERVLGPEEQICQTLDSYYPGNQTVDEALVIDIPQKHTPRPSPHYAYSMPQYMVERPAVAAEENGYFPPMPVIPSPHAAPSNHSGSMHLPPQVHAMSVLTTGQVPALPSPGGRGFRHGGSGQHRPRFNRNHTSSPTVINSAPPGQQPVGTAPFPHHLPLPSPRLYIDNMLSSDQNKQIGGGVNVPAPPPLPTPPAPLSEHKSITPPGRTMSPRPAPRMKKSKKSSATRENGPSASAGLLDGTVPPINVLIVEDNVINLRLLEAFMRRLKVRWKTAVNGREAVNKWREGGFHLVLMDIQLPIMSGLEATREIRRLERLNNIGVFSTAIVTDKELDPKTDGIEERNEHGKYVPQGDDVLQQRNLFRSPVIVVALTASSLQSDRHEALAAGCNDFLTKPVNFVWLERKVTEWGCMQALIDFDGWRKWKDFAASSAAESTKAGGPTVNGNGEPAKAKRKTMTIRRKKDPATEPPKTLQAPIPEKDESGPSREDSPAGGRTRGASTNSTGSANGETRRKSDFGSNSASTRDKSSSDASGGRAAAAPAVQEVNHLMVLDQA